MVTKLGMAGNLTDEQVERRPHEAGVDQHPTQLHQAAVVNVIGPLDSQVDFLGRQSQRVTNQPASRAENAHRK